MGDAVLSAFLQVLFDRLASKYVLDFIRACNMEKELKKLKKTLKNVNSFLSDAENKQYKTKPVKEWLDDLRDVAYDAEDVIDDVSMEAALWEKKLKLKSKSQTSSRKVSFSFIRTKISSKIKKVKDIKKARKIKEITMRFEELEGERSNLGLEEIKLDAAGSSRLITFRETSSLVDESHVFGRDGDQAKIIDLLLLKEQSSAGSGDGLIVIPIVGMGGVGKTTLAQLVYNDNNLLKDHFNLKAWVCVSSVEFDVKVITRSILHYITSTDCDTSQLNLDQLQCKVKDELTGKRFLIVLDDVWNKNPDMWDLLRKPFGVGASGSAIILTTRDGEIGSNMGTSVNYSLQKLSEDNCWSVFFQHAFGRAVDVNRDLIVIGKKIVKKCDGLPMAAKSLGGLLRSKGKFAWEIVLNSEIWDLPEEEIEILPVLKLSYYYLPSYLKRCFAYCSVFPKDYEFEEKRLVWLWMAEGFLEQPNGEMEPEKVGREYFRVLLSRSFFQPSSCDKSLYVMHDLIQNLAQWAAGQTCFRLEDSWDRSRQSNECIKVRHFSYIHDQYNEVQNFEDLAGVEFLRTFLLIGFRCWYRNLLTFDFLLKFKFLRVLSLCGYNISELPSSISDLKHLRYIDLSETYIQSLPESVSTLYNLQTLLCQSCPLMKLPKELQNLINLRHLDISNRILDRMEAMPPQIGKLTSLQTLSDFVVGRESGCGIEELANLKHLKGELRISKLENVIDDNQAKMANLSDKKGLNVLEMNWCSQFDNRPSENVEKDVLNMLRPHEELKKLSIKCYGGQSFPRWIGHASYTSMVFVELEGCERCTDLPPLGRLPLLKDLRIRRMNGVVTVGPGFYGEGCSNPFPSLETLSFEDMKEWRDWLPCVVEKCDNLFALLRKLSLEECFNLMGSLPHHLPSLEKLKVHKCKRLTVSISNYPKLDLLDIIYCQDVVQRSKVNLRSLKSMYLRHVSRATFLTEDLENVGCEELEIQGCENIENLKGLHNWTSLKELQMEECPKLVSFPERGLPATLRRLDISNCNALESLSEAISWHNCKNLSLELLYIGSCHSLTSIARASLFTTVKELKIMNCPSLQSLLKEEDEASSSMMQDSSNCRTFLLEVLYIERCPSLTSLFYLSSSSSGGELPATLKKLAIWYCPKLESLGERFRGNTSLHHIEITYCKSLKYLPENLHNLTGLSNFHILKCPSLVRFPDGGLPSANLRKLWIVECEKLEALPDRMHDLTYLQYLYIWNCQGIVSIPQEEGLPTNITKLEIGGPNICKALFQLGLHRLSSLRRLIINGGGCPNMVSFPAEQDISMVLPSSLIKLDILEFPNLERLSSKGFQNLTSLEELWILNCPKLQFLPEKGMFPSLLKLYICNCPLLNQRHEQEYPKISHVPYVQIDGKSIYGSEDKEE